MLRSMLTVLVVASVSGLPLVAGCDREVEHKREIEVNPNTGTVKKHEKTVTESPSGTVTEKETKSVDRP